MLAAHPPGEGTGSAVRGAMVLDALRNLFDRVDVVAFAHPGEGGFADPAVRLVPRRGPAPRALRPLLLPSGGTYFFDERDGRLAAAAQARAREAGGRYDLVWAYAPLVARAGRAVDARARVLDVDNVPSADLRGRADASDGALRRAWLRVQAVTLARAERARADLYDAVTVTSDEERERLGPVRPPVLVVPNAVPEVPAAPVAAGGPLALFVGSLHYGPNVEAVRWLAAEVVPELRRLAPQAAVRVVGRGPVPEVREACAAAGVELVADAPSLREHYDAARVVLAPLRTGGGTGRIKVLEALAHGAPLVATPQAVEGLDLEAGREVLVAPDGAGLAAHAARLLADPEAAAALGRAGRDAWRRDHGPDDLGRRVGAVVGQVLA